MDDDCRGGPQRLPSPENRPFSWIIYLLNHLNASLSLSPVFSDTIMHLADDCLDASAHPRGLLLCLKTPKTSRSASAPPTCAPASAPTLDENTPKKRSQACTLCRCRWTLFLSLDLHHSEECQLNKLCYIHCILNNHGMTLFIQDTFRSQITLCLLHHQMIELVRIDQEQWLISFPVWVTFLLSCC